MPKRPGVLIAAALLLGIALAWRPLLSPRTSVLYGYEPRRAALLDALRSPDPEARKRAAWATIDSPDPRLEAVLVQGVFGDEPDADVREAFVYSLGQLERPENMSAVEFALDLDESGRVRAAAWLAAARIDPQHFRTLAAAAAAAPVGDAWDRLGLAQAWLSLGDVRGVAELLRLAGDTDHDRRVTSARALDKWLLPLLDSAGALPPEVQPPGPEGWPAASLARLAQRTARLDLQSVADDLRQHAPAAGRLERDLRRITSARERIARALFGSRAG